MYGAYWCSHCYEQKQKLGKEAMKYVTYVECAKDGLNSQTKTCKANDIPGYPTWKVRMLHRPTLRVRFLVLLLDALYEKRLHSLKTRLHPAPRNHFDR